MQASMPGSVSISIGRAPYRLRPRQETQTHIVCFRPIANRAPSCPLQVLFFGILQSQRRRTAQVCEAYNDHARSSDFGSEPTFSTGIQP